MSKLPISAIVASYNEGHLLEDCLKSIQFCDEIVVVNLNSTDDTESIAKKYATKYYLELEDKLFFDAYHPKYLPLLKNEWIMLIDPDERISFELKESLEQFFISIPIDCGKINVPIRYYYKNVPLKGTVWGGDKYGRLLIRKTGNEIIGTVHSSIKLKEKYLTYKIPYTGNNVDHHFWVQSYQQMLNKHLRYIQKEGESKYKNGIRFNWFNTIKETIHAFYDSYFHCKGYKDYFLGLWLSLFYSWYVFSAYVSLKKYQKQLQ